MNTKAPEREAGNALLGALRAQDWSLLRPHLEAHAFTRGETLFRQGEHVEFAAFPCERLVVSLRVTSADGLTCEAASIGREGAIGGIVSQGAAPAFATASVQTKGAAWRIAVARLDELKAQSAALRDLFARYADALLAQVAQNAACNALHDVEQRTANWLLAFQGRFGGAGLGAKGLGATSLAGPDLPVTQEDVAIALGVGRPYASRRLNAMRKRGLVDLRRRVIRIREREALERVACGCRHAVDAHFAATMAGLAPPEEAE